MQSDHADALTAIRAALRGPVLRAAVCGLLLALFGAQLILQAHAVDHQLLPSHQQACEHCVIAKVPVPPAAAVTVVLAAAPRVVPPVEVAPLTTASVPLVERSRGPPSAA